MSDTGQMAVVPQRLSVGGDVASLTVKVAAARLDAAHLRREAATLRWTTRMTVRECKERRHSCLVNYARACRLRARPLASPWSTLLWQRPGPYLDQVLVVVSTRSD